jgi:hypothetical protein
MAISYTIHCLPNDVPSSQWHRTRNKGQETRNKHDMVGQWYYKYKTALFGTRKMLSTCLRRRYRDKLHREPVSSSVGAHKSTSVKVSIHAVKAC